VILDELHKKKLISPPHFILANTQYLSIMGSNAYGVADTNVKDKVPDFDIYGFCIPGKNVLFPHLAGHIPGFGTSPEKFDQWQQPHILDPDANMGKGKEYDFQVFNIVKMFELCRQGNPNMLDSLFTPENCIVHITQVGRKVRDNRKLFVSKLVWDKFRGYAFSQLHKLESKEIEGSKELAQLRKIEEQHEIDKKTTLREIEEEMKRRKHNTPGARMSLQSMTDEELKEYYELYKTGVTKSNRFEIHKRHLYDVKFAYHLYRLLDEAQQLLETGEMDLQRAKEPMKAIRRGEWKKEDLVKWAQEKAAELDVAFTNTKLPQKPDEMQLKKLLMECLEMHYGSLDKAFYLPGKEENLLQQIAAMVKDYV
jgi:hypothetical protein